jgi:Fe-S oxidoreductase
MTIHSTIFSIVAAISILFFLWSCYQRFFLITLGKKENRFKHIGKRLWGVLVYVFAQKRVINRPFGFNHFFLFWSFMILLLANLEFLTNGMFPNISFALLGDSMHNGLLFLFDIVSFIALICVLNAFMRRLFFVPPYIETAYVKAKSFDALLILSLIGILMIAFFGIHAAEIILSNNYAYMPFSHILSKCLAGLSTPTIENIWLISWWVHAIVLLGFLNYLPYSKHMHILAAIPNCFFRYLEKPNTQPRETFKIGNNYGVSTVQDFTWKDLLDGYACTECGRCQDACPAHNTEKPLNPRQIVHDIKINLLVNGKNIIKKEDIKLPLIGSTTEGSILEDAIWSCTTCGACLEVCPELIEHMLKIVKMRRYLVEMESKFPEELLNLFENIEQRSNPWGIAPADRTKWATYLDVAEFNADKTEYLFYVGCAGAFDSRNKQVTLAIALLLNQAGVSWGILGKDEKCCGDSLRRLGNEFVFDKLAQENVALLNNRKVKKIITQCPHCYNTIKNDYKQYGLNVEVIHHSEFIRELINSNKLNIEKYANNSGKIVFHDSCYLGRHNDIYEAPRDVIELTTGCKPTEMNKNKNNSFCCGAGGGRMWMEENLGKRINTTRINDAVAKNPNTISVACPYCLTMFEDGLKDLKLNNIFVKDIAEVAAEALLRTNN